MNHVLKGKWITRTRAGVQREGGRGGKLTKLKYRTKRKGAFRESFQYMQAIVQEGIGIVEDNIFTTAFCDIADFNIKKWVK